MVHNSVFNIFHLLVYFIYEVIQIIRVNNVLLFVFKCAETSLELVDVLFGETTQSMLRTSNLRDHWFEFLNSLLVRASAIWLLSRAFRKSWTTSSWRSTTQWAPLTLLMWTTLVMLVRVGPMRLNVQHSTNVVLRYLIESHVDIPQGLL